MRKTLIKFLFQHWWLTFLLMGLFFFLFGVTSLNLFVLLKANIDLYIEHGAMVIADGALRQLIELLSYGYLSLLFYTLFKVCENVLVNRLTGIRRDV
ncbi:MAG: hypothetical protein H6975_07775 [Gammaproteobacteria bacterium]|nr:hypothetical protein [Gammaproteobacteria bacterium]